MVHDTNFVNQVHTEHDTIHHLLFYLLFYLHSSLFYQTYVNVTFLMSHHNFSKVYIQILLSHIVAISYIIVLLFMNVATLHTAMYDQINSNLFFCLLLFYMLGIMSTKPFMEKANTENGEHRYKKTRIDGGPNYTYHDLLDCIFTLTYVLWIM